ncbi:hypothetical protein JVT61DRAFT_6971 [Boletus reticuloceps]|uniref:Uncharacterized protein n=1 Tax=Boletus reticuloceps TaxID=495285 RepID=A0A8I3A7Z6_9AGAM|nr:hypothetical protein JVT61DRAFT_6971 [Boletus reticuloceps]
MKLGCPSATLMYFFHSLHLIDLCWRTVDESKIIPVDSSWLLDKSLFDEYDICITGAAMKQFQSSLSWNDLVHPLRKSSFSPALRPLGTSPWWLAMEQMMLVHPNRLTSALRSRMGLSRTCRGLLSTKRWIKKVYKSQLKISAHLGQPPPPVPPAIAPPVPGCCRGSEEGCGQHADCKAERSDGEGWFFVMFW